MKCFQFALIVLSGIQFQCADSQQVIDGIGFNRTRKMQPVFGQYLAFKPETILYDFTPYPEYESSYVVNLTKNSS